MSERAHQGECPQATTTEGAPTGAPCATCRMRAAYERNPRSLVGRFWRWHIRWCPGWKSYLESLPAEERETLRRKLKLS